MSLEVAIAGFLEDAPAAQRRTQHRFEKETEGLLSEILRSSPAGPVKASV